MRPGGLRGSPRRTASPPEVEDLCRGYPELDQRDARALCGLDDGPGAEEASARVQAVLGSGPLRRGRMAGGVRTPRRCRWGTCPTCPEPDTCQPSAFGSGAGARPAQDERRRSLLTVRGVDTAPMATRPGWTPLAALAAGVAAVVMAGLIIAVGLLVFRVVSDLRDAPRSFDPDELEPILEGTEVVEPSVEFCPQGGNPIGDCGARAVIVSSNVDRTVAQVAANAEEAGFTRAGRRRDALLFAVRGEACLTVDARTPSGPELGVLMDWCS